MKYNDIFCIAIICSFIVCAMVLLGLRYEAVGASLAAVVCIYWDSLNVEDGDDPK